MFSAVLTAMMLFIQTHPDFVAFVAYPLVTGVINYVFRPMTPLGKFLRGAGFDSVKVIEGARMLLRRFFPKYFPTPIPAPPATPEDQLLPPAGDK